ncbi:hypothetical protein JCM6882_004012 [Rhodosporidiobolus microsporus]
MCSNITSLVYGLPVRTYTLARAADAWPSLEPAFRFFDLVSLRLCKGELKSTKAEGVGTVIERVPLKVWMLVRNELIDVELAKAERGLIDEFCCEWAYLDDDRGADTISTAPDWRKAAYVTSPCVRCGISRSFEWVDVWKGSRLQRAADCLAAFDLAPPLASSLRSLPSWTRTVQPWIDPSDATFVVAKRPSIAAERTDWTFSVLEGGLVGEIDEQAVFDLSFESPLPPTRDLRAFLRTLRVEPLAVLDDTRAAPADGGLAIADADKVRDSRFSPQTLSSVEPRWMLTTTCKSGY